MAAHDPAGPPPTTMTSTSRRQVARSARQRRRSVRRRCGEEIQERVERGVGVGRDGQVGELHHRAVRVGVDADDVRRRAEPAGVLHGPADAEGEVQLRVDDDAGGADLAVVADPAAVGDHPGRADAGAERHAEVGELVEALAAPSSPAPPPTMRGASARSTVAASAGSMATVSASRTTSAAPTPAGSTERNVIGSGPRRAPRRAPRLQRGDEALRTEHLVQLPPAAADELDDRSPTDRALASSGRSMRRSQARREIAAVGRGRQHDHRFVDEQRGQAGGPRGGLRRAGLDHQHLVGHAAARRASRRPRRRPSRSAGRVRRTRRWSPHRRRDRPVAHHHHASTAAR